MSERDIPPALKHGVYSGMTVLPGENADAFKKLHDDLIAELAPVGPIEGDVVESIARLTWRKRNLSTYRVVSEASARYSAIKSPKVTYESLVADYYPNGRELEEGLEEKARKELGSTFELAKLGEIVKADYLVQELALIDKLDGMIDRCLKRLLFVRGLKSLQTSSSATPPRKKLSAA
jgi:hypothetical protein